MNKNMWIIITTAATAFIIGMSSIFFLGEDNPIEELSEEIIEHITGIEEIDLSPWKNEEKDEELNDIQQLSK